MGWFSDSRQRQVLKLEPSRRASAIGNLILFLLTATVSTAATLYRLDEWPAAIQQPNLDIPDRALLIVAGVAGGFALLALAAGIYNLSRWRLTRRVIKASRSPTLSGMIPTHETVIAPRRAAAPPPLNVEFLKARKFPKPPKPLHQVAQQSNVLNQPPINIAYLRLFDNQPRARTFLESAWREFGYVFFLRAATSVTRREYKDTRRLGSLGEMFLANDDTFDAVLRLAPTTPLRKGRIVLPNVAPTRVRTRDPYGTYPIRAILCHGEYWQRAIDILLGRADLVVLDLSGFTQRNAGTGYEVQRTIDTVPIERVIILCDAASSRRFLGDVIQQAWSQMDAASPNAAGGPRFVMVAVTDQIRRSTSQQGNQEVTRVRLVSVRRHSRNVAAWAYGAALAHRQP